MDKLDLVTRFNLHNLKSGDVLVLRSDDVSAESLQQLRRRLIEGGAPEDIALICMGKDDAFELLSPEEKKRLKELLDG